nr:DUF3040 domain-containing protein [Streptomyces sp. SID8499]
MRSYGPHRPRPGGVLPRVRRASPGPSAGRHRRIRPVAGSEGALVNYERELAQIEKQLVTQDPLLAEKLETFEQITAPRPPRAGPRRRVYLLAAIVFVLLALTSALASGAATEHPRPPQVVPEQPAGSG